MKNNAHVTPPQTVGEHIKCKRFANGLTQKQAALFIGVDAYTVLNWEKSKTTPSPKDFPGIVHFLGHVPLRQPSTLAERLYSARCIRGWSIKEAGRAAGIHEETWGYWERGQNLPQKRMWESIEQFLARLQFSNQSQCSHPLSGCLFLSALEQGQGRPAVFAGRRSAPLTLWKGNTLAHG